MLNEKSKRIKFPYARSSQAASTHPRGIFFKPNVESSCPKVSEKNIVVVDRHIRKIVAQTLGTNRDETIPIPTKVNMGIKPHDTTASSRLEMVGGEARLAKLATLVLEEVRTTAKQGVEKSSAGKECSVTRHTPKPR